MKRTAGVMERSGSFKLKPRKITTLSFDEVVWLFGVDETVVEKWIKQGTLTPCRKGLRGNTRFLREDVSDLLAAFGV